MALLKLFVGMGTFVLNYVAIEPKLDYKLVSSSSFYDDISSITLVTTLPFTELVSDSISSTG